MARLATTRPGRLVSDKTVASGPTGPYGRVGRRGALDICNVLCLYTTVQPNWSHRYPYIEEVDISCRSSSSSAFRQRRAKNSKLTLGGLEVRSWDPVVRADVQGHVHPPATTISIISRTISALEAFFCTVHIAQSPRSFVLHRSVYHRHARPDLNEPQDYTFAAFLTSRREFGRHGADGSDLGATVATAEPIPIAVWFATPPAARRTGHGALFNDLCTVQKNASKADTVLKMIEMVNQEWLVGGVCTCP
ncbi:unnamed protein product (mitochondrion) [Plasmodiophora brassicae]|uniref:Uncharacterized protein n=1 Tax=Plasmodiophora brassicae TaxID=37360 RepID=A0A0G4IPU7_PLABS|nr:hypothetical protein PBRA_000572 [Plasmodiophora brassicae]SPQ97537.1 unnamed protein product [Plasmodiophora brassicae]